MKVEVRRSREPITATEVAAGFKKLEQSPQAQRVRASAQAIIVPIVDAHIEILRKHGFIPQQGDDK